MNVAEMKAYASKLVRIPNVIDDGEGGALCREIGKEIYDKHGFEAMVLVCEYVRDHIDRVTARKIEHAWDNIGPWCS